MPVTGITPTFIPTLTKTWKSSIVAIPAAIMLPNKFFERVAIRSARQISRA